MTFQNLQSSSSMATLGPPNALSVLSMMISAHVGNALGVGVGPAVGPLVGACAQRHVFARRRVVARVERPA